MAKKISNFEIKKIIGGGDYAVKAIATGLYMDKFFKIRFQGGTWGDTIKWDVPRGKIKPSMQNTVESYSWKAFDDM